MGELGVLRRSGRTLTLEMDHTSLSSAKRGRGTTVTLYFFTCLGACGWEEYSLALIIFSILIHFNTFMCKPAKHLEMQQRSLEHDAQTHTL